VGAFLFFHFIGSLFIMGEEGEKAMEKIKEDVKEYLMFYESLLKEVLSPERIHGVYIYGSIALGAFDPETSDIDFITVINGAIGKEEEELLNLVHLRSKSHPYGARMDGCYLTQDLAGKVNQEMEPYLYAADGKLERGYHDLNYITWWILQTKGITIYGEPITSLNFEVKWEDVQKTLDYNLNSYWKEKLQQDNCFFYDDWVEFGVTTLCRIYLSLESHSILSKRDAAEQSLNLLPVLYHPIVLEGLRLRAEPRSESHYHSKSARKVDMTRFLTYILTYCNETYKLQKL
jgi:hypothetical protein